MKTPEKAKKIRKYFKYIKRLARFRDIVVAVDDAGCMVQEVGGQYEWSYYKKYRGGDGTEWQQWWLGQTR